MLTTIFGRRGSGKTTVIRAMIPHCHKPTIVIDVLGNFTPNSGDEKDNPNSKDWKLVTSVSQLMREMKIWATSQDEKSSGVFVVQTQSISEAVDYASSALWQLHGGTLVLDEADFVSLAEAPAFDDLIRYGRNRGVDVITGCRRPAELSRNITAGSDRFLCFMTHEPRDVEYFSKLFGKEIAEELPRLEKYHGVYIHYLEEIQGKYKTNAQGQIIVLSKDKKL